MRGEGGRTRREDRILSGEQGRAFALGLSLLLVLGVGGLLLASAQFQPVVSDSIGYVQAARSLAAGSGPTYFDRHNAEFGPYFYPHAFRLLDGPAATAVFGYPPGFPTLLALLSRLSGRPSALYWGAPLLAVCGLIATWLLARQVSPHPWTAPLALLILVSAGSFWTFGTAPWSEVPSMLLMTGGICCYLWMGQATGRRVRLTAALLTGVLLGTALFVRYTNLLLFLPPLLIHGWMTMGWRWIRRPETYLIYGGIGLFGVGVLVYNTVYFGGPTNTIYNTYALGAYAWPKFSLGYALGPSPVAGYNVAGILRTLWLDFTVWLVLAPFGWALLKRQQTILVAGVVLTTIGLYAVYAFSSTGVNARFLLPAYPFLAVSAAHGAVAAVVRWGGDGFSGRLWASVVAAAGLLTLAAVPGHVRDVQARNQADAVTVEQVQRMVQPTAPDAVFMGQALNDLVAVYGERSVFNYRRILQVDSDTGRFDMDEFRACVIGVVDRLLMSGIPVYFVQEEAWGIGDLLEENYDLDRLANDSPIMRVNASGSEARAPVLNAACGALQRYPPVR